MPPSANRTLAHASTPQALKMQRLPVAGPGANLPRKK